MVTSLYWFSMSQRKWLGPMGRKPIVWETVFNPWKKWIKLSGLSYSRQLRVLDSNSVFSPIIWLVTAVLSPVLTMLPHEKVWLVLDMIFYANIAKCSPVILKTLPLGGSEACILWHCQYQALWPQGKSCLRASSSFIYSVDIYIGRHAISSLQPKGQTACL